MTGRQAQSELIFSYNSFQTQTLILFIVLYSLISSLRVSQFQTHPMSPVFTVKGIIEYLVIYKSLFRFSLSLAKSLLTKLKNCITLSSRRKSYLPFNKKLYSLPSSPKIVSFRGLCFDWRITNSLENPVIFTQFFPGKYIPGMVDLYFLLVTRNGATFLRQTFLMF